MALLGTIILLVAVAGLLAYAARNGQDNAARKNGERKAADDERTPS